MLTIHIWEHFVFYALFGYDAFDIFVACLVSIITIPIDILTLPLQVVALGIYAIISLLNER